MSEHFIISSTDDTGNEDWGFGPDDWEDIEVCSSAKRARDFLDKVLEEARPIDVVPEPLFALHHLSDLHRVDERKPEAGVRELVNDADTFVVYRQNAIELPMPFPIFELGQKALWSAIKAELTDDTPESEHDI